MPDVDSEKGLAVRTIRNEVGFTWGTVRGEGRAEEMSRLQAQLRAAEKEMDALKAARQVHATGRV